MAADGQAKTLAEELLQDIRDVVPEGKPRSYADTPAGPRLSEDPRSLSVALGSQRLSAVLAGVSSTPSEGAERERYQLVVDCNELLSELQRDVRAVHAALREVFAMRLPELESFVTGPGDFARAVRMIGNSRDVASLPLATVMPAAAAMGVSVSAATTTGRLLREEELEWVRRACDVIEELEETRKRLVTHVEGQMTFIAPNVCALVGSAIAAQLVVTAGGLTALTRLAGNAVQVLGQKEQAQLQGFSAAHHRPHMGYISCCDLVRSCPPDMQMSACRKVACKVVLAARFDASRDRASAPDSKMGERLRAELEGVLDKLQEPPPVREVRAVPAPDEKRKTRRGGERLRKQKGRLEMTEMRKQANRMAFGAAEDEYRGTGKGFGMLGMEGSGQVRLTAVDKGILKKVKKDAAAAVAVSGLATQGFRARAHAAGGTTSVVLGSAQGIELANPSAKRAKQGQAPSSSRGYFNAAAPFKRAHP